LLILKQRDASCHRFIAFRLKRWLIRTHYRRCPDLSVMVVVSGRCIIFAFKDIVFSAFDETVGYGHGAGDIDAERQRIIMGFLHAFSFRKKSAISVMTVVFLDYRFFFQDISIINPAIGGLPVLSPKSQQRGIWLRCSEKPSGGCIDHWPVNVVVSCHSSRWRERRRNGINAWTAVDVRGRAAPG
jgi:hypothetical protein